MSRNGNGNGRKLVLNAFGSAFLRSPNDEPDQLWSIDSVAEFGREAERALFDAVFLADSPSLQALSPDRPAILMPEPLTVLSILAAHTTYLGLAATVLTTYSEPYNTARQIASLDQLSGGRAGWNAVTGSQPSVAPNFGPNGHPEHALRYERGNEYIEIVKQLWDSWEPDALTRRNGGFYADPTKVHKVPFDGKHFQLDALFNVPRSPQGRPVLFHAGSSDIGRDQGAQHADAIFTAQPTIDAARAFYSDFKRRVTGFGRNPDHALVLPGILPVVGSTEAEAQAKFDEQSAAVDLEATAPFLKQTIGLDISGLDFDAPIPETLWDSTAATTNFVSRIEVMRAEAKERKLTARQVITRSTAAFGHHIVIGSPEQVADDMELWFRTGAADGFNYRLPHGREDFDVFIDQILPLLQARGIFREEYEETTLRGHYGLPSPN
jgi:N-acetyl-S-(2-succino)cysteine monooxygenase